MKRSVMGILNHALANMKGNCDYTGPDFEEACKVSKETGHAIYERNSDRGKFLVVWPDSDLLRWQDDWEEYE